MTCYDCIHCGACSDAGDSGFSCLKEDVSKCEHFKNKADFVEVVLCKDCKNYITRESAPNFCMRRRCSIRENDFCSDGERRDT